MVELNIIELKDGLCHIGTLVILGTKGGLLNFSLGFGQGTTHC